MTKPAGEESFSEQLSRVLQMADGGESWDLSENDALALRALLNSHAELLAALKEFVEWHGAAHAEDCPADDTCDCIGGAINKRVNAAIARAESHT